MRRLRAVSGAMAGGMLAWCPQMNRRLAAMSTSGIHGLGHMTHELCGKNFFPHNIGVSLALKCYTSSAMLTRPRQQHTAMDLRVLLYPGMERFPVIVLDAEERLLQRERPLVEGHP